MGLQDILRAARAEAAARVFRDLGVRVDLVREGVTYPNLVAFLVRHDAAWEERLARLGRAERVVFQLPLQAGVSTHPAPGDLAIYPAGSDQRFVIARVKEDLGGGVFEVHAERQSAPLAATAE